MIDSMRGGDASGASTSQAGDSSRPRAAVVLLHGLGANSWAMWLLARRLRKAGYCIENWGYRSVGQSLDTLVARFSGRLQQYHDEIGEEMPLHVVGHSMGAVIFRGAMARGEFPRLHRAVLLSPPNRGSHVATRIGHRLRWLSPAIADLADHPESYVNSLPLQMQGEVGVIAAAPDFVVAAESTHLPDQRDHITMPGPHGALVFRRDVSMQVQHFLQHGAFFRAGDDAAMLGPTLLRAKSTRPNTAASSPLAK